MQIALAWVTRIMSNFCHVFNWMSNFSMKSFAHHRKKHIVIYDLKSSFCARLKIQSRKHLLFYCDFDSIFSHCFFQLQMIINIVFVFFTNLTINCKSCTQHNTHRFKKKASGKIFSASLLIGHFGFSVKFQFKVRKNKLKIGW